MDDLTLLGMLADTHEQVLVRRQRIGLARFRYEIEVGGPQGAAHNVVAVGFTIEEAMTNLMRHYLRPTDQSAP